MKRILLPLVFLALTLVSVRAQVILQDDFNYANGILTNVSSGLWVNHSGTPDTAVSGGKVEVFSSRFGDVSRPLTNTPGTTIYASFVVRMTSLPSARSLLCSLQRQWYSKFQGADLGTGTCRYCAG